MPEDNDSEDAHSEEPGAGGPGGGSEGGNEELVREVRQLRDEVHDIRRTLERIADALED